MRNGKSDKRRPCDYGKYRNNFSNIVWKTKKTQGKQSKQDKAASQSPSNSNK